MSARRKRSRRIRDLRSMIANGHLRAHEADLIANTNGLGSRAGLARDSTAARLSRARRGVHPFKVGRWAIEQANRQRSLRDK